MKARVRWSVLPGLLVLALMMAGIWFLGPVQWQDALERPRRPDAPPGEVERGIAQRPPTLAGRPARVEPAVPPPRPAETVEPPPTTEAAQGTARGYEGVVVDADGKRIGGATLLFKEGSFEQWEQPDAAGRFDVLLPVPPQPGCLVVVACAPGYSDGRRLLPPDGATGLEIVLHEDRMRGTVRHRVLKPDGTPAEGAWVYVLNRPATGEPIGGASPVLWRRYPDEGVTDAEGVFITHGILVGETLVTAQLGNLVVAESPWLTWPETRVEVTLRRGRTIRGRVRVSCRADCTHEGHEVRVRIAWFPRAGHRVRAGREEATPFEVHGVPLDRVTVRLRAKGHEARRIEVPASSAPETVDLSEIVLAPDR